MSEEIDLLTALCNVLGYNVKRTPGLENEAGQILVKAHFELTEIPEVSIKEKWA